MNPPISFACRPSPSDPNSPQTGRFGFASVILDPAVARPLGLGHRSKILRSWCRLSKTFSIPISRNVAIVEFRAMRNQDPRSASQVMSAPTRSGYCVDAQTCSPGRGAAQIRTFITSLARAGIRRFRPRAVRQAKRKSPSPRARRASYGGRANRADGLPSSPRRIRRRRARGGRAARTRPRCA